MNRTKSFIKILSVLSFLLMAGNIFSCANILRPDQENSEKMVTYHLCVTPEMITPRSAYPAFDASQMANFVYTLTQSSTVGSASVKQGTYNNGKILFDFKVGVSVTTINLTFYICDGSYTKPMWSGTTSFSPSTEQYNKPVNLSVRFSPMSAGGTSILATTKGNIDLEIQTDSGCTVQCTIPNATLSGISITSIGNTCKIQGSGDESITQGEYVAEITVKNSAGKVVRRQTHTIYVWRGITTNAWYLGDGSKNRVLTLSATTNEMEFYVRGTNPGGFYANVPAGVTVANTSDSNSGSILNPLATLQSAIGKCTDSGTDYRIYVSGTLYGQVLIGGSSSVNAQSISIIGMTGSSTDVINGNFVSPTAGGITIKINTSVPVTLKDLKVTGGNNNDGDGGGGIKIEGGGTLNLEGNTCVTGNTADFGAGVYCLEATVNIKDNVSVTNNTATEMGGGVFIQNSIAKLTISDNVSISNNEANEGGGIGACASATIEMNGGSISGNTGTSVENGGGGVRLWNAHLKMMGGQISENISPNIGSAISIGGSSSFEVSNSAYIPSGVTKPNDIYLDSGNTITIAGALTPPAACTDGIIATITPSSYTDGAQVLDVAASPSPDTTLAAEYTRFAVTPENQGAADEKLWGVTSEGKLREWGLLVNVPAGTNATFDGTTAISGSSVFISGRDLGAMRSLIVCDHEVTQGEYEKYCTYGGTQPNATYGVGENYPAYYVSWYDALVYCNKRSSEEGFTPCYTINGSTDPAAWGAIPSSDNETWNVTCDFGATGWRLPTEAEWEYLARGGNLTNSGQTTYSGSGEIDDVAWYTTNSGSKAQVVCMKQPNALGLYDMSGNVNEWCWDWYNDIATTTAPTGPTGGDPSYPTRVFRGGCYQGNPVTCSVFERNGFTPSYRSYLVGFRVVRTAE